MREPSSPNVHPEPFFGWLDYDAEAAGQMRDVFAAFDEKGTLDSLGLGVIRDGIADSLFPGVSTIQTRARYFLIVPWICQHLEARRLGRGNAEQDLRWHEARTIMVLKQHCSDSDGVIGWEAGKDLKRMPSSVYWNGIGVLGIRRDSALSLSQYLSTISGGSRDLLAERSDDDGESTGSPRGFWDEGMPSAPTGFPDPVEAFDLTLLEKEANYLRDKFTIHSLDGKPEESLLSHLASNPELDRQHDLPWLVALENPSDGLRARLRHAKLFSEATQGSRILYNHLLAVKSRERDLFGKEMLSGMEEKTAAVFTEWSDAVIANKRELRKWSESLPDFWKFVEQFSNPSDPAKKFVKKWLSLALEDPAGILENKEAQNLIVDREYRLKRQLARLSNDRALESYGGGLFGAAPYEYRWSNARNHLEDIVNHSGVVNAAA